VTERAGTTRQARGTGARGAGDGAASEFERLYRANVEAVTAYFARRSADPHVVADLTADTFVTAAPSPSPRPSPAPWWPGAKARPTR
jgi:DNA-directed RNA polymerase specialized sigma24 family protein